MRKSAPRILRRWLPARRRPGGTSSPGRRSPPWASQGRFPGLFPWTSGVSVGVGGWWSILPRGPRPAQAGQPRPTLLLRSLLYPTPGPFVPGPRGVRSYGEWMVRLEESRQPALALKTRVMSTGTPLSGPRSLRGWRRS
jgi:hypothetical protein